MDDFGVLMVFVYVTVGPVGSVEQKRVTLLNRHSVTKEEGRALYEEFKKNNGHITGLCCRWQPDSVFIA